jgi:hypothetical protein
VQSPSSREFERPVSTPSGVLVALVAAGLLGFASLVFGFYGYCEDSCDNGHPWAFWPAADAALPYALPALGLMVLACHLFMRRRSARPRWFRAAVVALVSSAAFVAGLWLLAVELGAFVNQDSPALFLVGMLVLVPLWIGATIAVAQRAARTRSRGQDAPNGGADADRGTARRRPAAQAQRAR